MQLLWLVMYWKCIFYANAQLNCTERQKKLHFFFRKTLAEIHCIKNLSSLDTNKLYRVAQKEHNTYDQLFQRKEGQNKQVVCIIAYKMLFSSKMTPRSFILMKAFWFYGRVSEAMSLLKFATFVFIKVTIDIPKFSIVWLPWVKCLLLDWKTKTARLQRNIHYATLQCDNPGKALKKFGANAVSYPCRYLDFHSTNLHQNHRKYLSTYFQSLT